MVDGHSGAVWSVTVLRDERVVVSGGQDGKEMVCKVGGLCG